MKIICIVTDIEMRLGYLGRLSDLPLNGQMPGTHPGISSDLHRPGHPVGGTFVGIYFVYMFAYTYTGTLKLISFRME